MAVMDVDYSGSLKIEEAMEALPYEVSLTCLGPGCYRAARIIAYNLILSINNRTGNLKRSVKAVRIKDWINAGGTRVTVPGGKTIIKYGGEGARHGQLIEFGTVKAPPQMLLQKASNVNVQGQHDAFLEGIERELHKVVNNAAKGKLSVAARRIINKLN